MNPTVAIQSSDQPTNKVSAAVNVGGGIGAVLAGVAASYLGPMLEENLAGRVGPSTMAFIIALAVAAASWVGTKYGGQAAAYNVLDAPNVPLQPVMAAPAP